MTFMSLPMPTLETERLILRPWQEDDLGFLLEIFGNEETAKYVGGKEETRLTWRRMGMIMGHYLIRGFTVFVVERKGDNKAIGYAGPWYPYEWPEPEIGYAFTPDAHGKGFATEAARASLNYAYKTLGWKTAISLMNAENEGSKGVAKKLGARFESKTLLFNQHPAEIWRYPSPSEFS